MVAEHEQEGLVADVFAGGKYGVAKAFLVLLDDEVDLLAHLQQAAGIVLEMRRQLVEILNRNLGVEEDCGNRSGHPAGR